MFDVFDWFISSHHRILISIGSWALARILASLNPHILMSVCICLYPRILTFSYLQVVWSLEITYIFDIFDCLISSHSNITMSLGSCALACILASSHPHILMSVFTCLYPHILTFSHLQVHIPFLASLHPHILRFLWACLYPCILTSSYHQVHMC